MSIATDTFCGRATEQLAIAEALDPTKPGQKGIALCGIGGSGKTQLALRYIEQHRQLYAAVIWINASSTQHTAQSFVEAADMISSYWPSRDCPLTYAGPSNWLKVVTRLRSTCYTRWLLIIDSVDDLNQDNFRQYIPSCNYGSIIVTSTQNQAPEVFRLLRLEVARLDPNSSRELLLTCAFGSIDNTPISEDGKDSSRPVKRFSNDYLDSRLATAIVSELHGLPLAIEQAGALLRTVFSLSEFVSAYRTHYRLLMSKYPSEGILSYDKQRSIITVFEMLFQSIKTRNPEAAALLIFTAILGPWQIPVSLMDQFPLNEITFHDPMDEDTKALTTVLENNTVLRLALGDLASVCLVKLRRNRASSCQTFSLHRAVCEWCVQRAASEKKDWIIQATRTLALSILSPTRRCVKLFY